MPRPIFHGHQHLAGTAINIQFPTVHRAVDQEDPLIPAKVHRPRVERRTRALPGPTPLRLERLLAARGGAVVAPAAGEPFSGTTMEATEVVATDDPAADRTVAELLAPGLPAGGRSVRPSRVKVWRHRAE